MSRKRHFAVVCAASNALRATFALALQLCMAGARRDESDNKRSLMSIMLVFLTWQGAAPICRTFIPDNPQRADPPIMIRAQPTSWRQLAWCLALAMSLLVTQFGGQWHRINHARWLDGTVTTQVKAENPERQWAGLVDVKHSCIALDALSLANGAASAIALLLPAYNATLIFNTVGACLWDAPFNAQFNSRAPPARQ